MHSAFSWASLTDQRQADNDRKTRLLDLFPARKTADNQLVQQEDCTAQDPV